MVESSGLLNRRRVKNSTGGSNPPLSAILESIVWYPSPGVSPPPFRRSALSSPFRSPTMVGMAEYRQSAHAVFDLKYHMIWCTKYRKKVLRGRVAERARDLIRQVCAARDVVILRGAVSPDHIHRLLSAPPILAPAKLAQFIKGRSSRHLQAEFPELRKQYWGQHMWARGYFCATVGAVDEATIKAYIENQKWDEDDESFKITAPSKP